jgi:hypothetical protein
MQIQSSKFAIATAATALFAAVTGAQAAPIAVYNFNEIADNTSNPAAADSAGTAGVTVSTLTRDAGGTGNADGLGTVSDDNTRDNTPDTFSSMTLAYSLGTTAKNPFASPTPTPIIADQDYVTFNVTAGAGGLALGSLTFDYGVSVNTTDTTGLQAAEQTFYSINGGAFTAIGAQQDRTVPSGGAGFFTGFTQSAIDLSTIPTLAAGDNIVFRLNFGDNSSSTTSSKGGYIDNVVLNGVVPEPASLALFGLAGMGLMARARRRA